MSDCRCCRRQQNLAFRDVVGVGAERYIAGGVLVTQQMVDDGIVTRWMLVNCLAHKDSATPADNKWVLVTYDRILATPAATCRATPATTCRAPDNRNGLPNTTSADAHADALDVDAKLIGMADVLYSKTNIFDMLRKIPGNKIFIAHPIVQLNESFTIVNPMHPMK